MAIKKSNTKRNKRKKTNKRKNEQPLIEDHISREIWAILYIVLSIIFILGLTGNAGFLGNKINQLLSLLFGIGKWLLPITFLSLSVTLFISKKVTFNPSRNLGILLFLSSFLGLIHLFTPIETMNENVEEYGGWIGFTSSVIFRIFFSTENSDLASFIILLGIFIISILITFKISFRNIIDFFFPVTELSEINNQNTENNTIQNNIEDAEIKVIKPNTNISNNTKPKLIEAETDNSSDFTIKRPNKEIKKTLKKKDSLEITNIKISGDWQLPSIDLLLPNIDDNYPSDSALQKQAQNIEEKLAEFGVKVQMVDARVGPTVSQFTMSPQEGVAVKKIANAKDDLALALAAKSVRIEAPIPGQPYVGIEIPNEQRATVYMQEILKSEEFAKINSPLRLALGKSVSGEAIIADLAKMPHLLIAGATGSGKSVGMNCFLISLLYQNSPEDLKFIMVDPKRVELSGYNGIPHLLTPVITEADKALAALKWSVNEMMRRYQECEEKGYRNIAEYNEQEEKKMSKIVIVIDELADLMMRDFRKDTEAAICRLAQMARAVGMHLIIATQRPSVDVITGVIKANIPTRIAFTVTSAIDSRTVLDSIGAEDLLGMGDMLFINQELPKPQRIQGIYISSKEIEKVVKHIKLAQDNSDIVKINLNEKEEGFANEDKIGVDLEAISAAASEDELVPEAIEIIKQTGKASATLLQRMLSIGYARAAKILDILEKKGIVGPANGAKPREIYLGKD